MSHVPELHRTIRPFCYFISCILYPNFIDIVDILLSCPWQKNERGPQLMTAYLMKNSVTSSLLYI